MSTVMIWQTHSTGSVATERLGELLGSQLHGSEVIELRSDLGGGKTTFVRGLVRGAGSPTKVTSPTFTLNRVYQTKHFDIHHFDFYRLSEPGILADQLAEVIDNQHAVVVVEWGDIVENVLPPARISVELKPVAANPDERQIIISYPPSKTPLIDRLQTDWQAVEP